MELGGDFEKHEMRFKLFTGNAGVPPAFESLCYSIEGEQSNPHLSRCAIRSGRAGRPRSQ